MKVENMKILMNEEDIGVSIRRIQAVYLISMLWVTV